MSKQLRLRRQNSVPNLSLATTSQGPEGNTATPAQALKRATTAIRFMVRLRIAAREWRKQEELRKVLVSKWNEYEKRGVPGNTGGTKKPAPAPATAPTPAFVAGGGGFKKPNAPTFAPPAARFVGGGGGVKKPAAPVFSFVKGGSIGFKKPANVAAAAAPSLPAPSAYLKNMDLRERVELSKRNNNRHDNGVNSELEEVESSAAPLGFDVDSSSREREDHRAAVQDWGELDGTEAFSVDSL